MQPNTKPARLPLNGVDTPNLLATINFVAGQPELAKFQFRAHNEWIEGTHSKTVMNGFFGAGQEQKHEKPHYADADHPAILCGGDNAPTPVEWLLHGLAGCLMAGVANIAAARGIKLTKVKCSVDGDIDLRGILASPTRSATASRTSMCRSRSKATRQPKSCSSWSSSRAPVRPSSTC